MKLIGIIVMSIFCIVFFSCRNVKDKQSNDDTIDMDALLRDTMARQRMEHDSMLAANTPSVSSESTIISFSNAVLETMKQKNFNRLAAYVDPQLGVTFYPYSYIDAEAKKNHFTKDQVVSVGNSVVKQHWGYADGSGEALSLNFKDYIDRFVYDVPFLQAKNVEANKSLFKSSNGIDNSLEVYKGLNFVDYYQPASDKSGMDWKNLRLIFNERDGQYFLIAVVHNQWQI